jgi:DNA-binding response OmpR family regulator
MKILIVEDEKKTGEYLTRGLTEAGFVVDLADNGLNGYHLAMTAEQCVVPRRTIAADALWRMAGNHHPGGTTGAK